VPAWVPCIGTLPQVRVAKSTVLVGCGATVGGVESFEILVAWVVAGILVTVSFALFLATIR